jgi:hypothetical protein
MIEGILRLLKELKVIPTIEISSVSQSIQTKAQISTGILLIIEITKVIRIQRVGKVLAPTFLETKRDAQSRRISWLEAAPRK